MPCGEYLWNHANGTMLRQWLIQEHILGPTGLGNANIDGFYVDDTWVNFQQEVQSWQPPEGFCDHWITGGASEEDLYCVSDSGLSQQDVTDITVNWAATMLEAAQAIRAHGGWAWYMLLPLHAPDRESCSFFFRTADIHINASILFEWTSPGTYPLPNVDVDIASFMLVRGPYAWLGYGWLGCTSNEVPGFGGQFPYTLPSEIPRLNVDYGTPLGPLQETSDGVFTRQWTNAIISMDCNTYTPSFVMK